MLYCDECPCLKEMVFHLPIQIECSKTRPRFCNLLTFAVAIVPSWNSDSKLLEVLQPSVNQFGSN
jgi:hypothetical protein